MMEFSIALGDSRQDIGVEGDIYAIINILRRVLGLEMYFDLYRSRRSNRKSQHHQHPGRAATGRSTAGRIAATERRSAGGGSHQDIRVEGDIATIINILYYLEFLDWTEAAERAV